MQIISVFFVCINGHYLFSLIIENQTSLACYGTFFTFDIGYPKSESFLFFALEGFLFRFIVHVIFTPFNINVPVFISWKPCVMFVTFTCNRWSTDFFDVELIEENKLVRCQRRKFFFLIPVWDRLHFHLLPFVINEKYVEGEMS